MDVLALRRQGWTTTQIAEALRRHPATVSNWLKRGGPPPRRQADPQLLTIDDHWAARINEILQKNPGLLGTSVERLLRAEGFKGSYPTLVRPPAGRTRSPPGCPGPGQCADRDPPRRGVPVRLVRLLRLGTGLGPGPAALPRGDPVLVPPPALVLRPVTGSPPHLRGPSCGSSRTPAGWPASGGPIAWAASVPHRAGRSASSPRHCPSRSLMASP